MNGDTKVNYAIEITYIVFIKICIISSNIFT